MKTSRIAAALAAGALALSCSHTRPEEMSAEAHRAEAAKHAKNARQEESKVNPNQPPPPPPPSGTIGNGPIPLGELWAYDPNAYHKYNAELEREHAQEHLRAAQALEGFEAKACEGIPKEQRAACPLLTPFVSAVQETQRGVIFHLKSADETGPLMKRMKCHWAFAQARAFDQKIACPLYERNVEIHAGKDPATIAVEGKTPAAAAHVRADLRQLFTGAQVVH